MGPRREFVMIEALRLVAPGTALRAGIDRVLQARRGALIVIGEQREVLAICTGGFSLNAELTPQRLSELAKMDGAIVVSGDTSRIARANVHLVPNPGIPTAETGTRHRSAERVSRSVHVPVVAVSEGMHRVTVYSEDQRHVLQAVQELWTRANQLLQTLQRFKERFDLEALSLSSLEVADLVTVRDVATLLQRAELVRRVAAEIEAHLIELGEEGELLKLQLSELTAGVEGELHNAVRDYLRDPRGTRVTNTLDALARLDSDDLVDLARIVAVLKPAGGEGALETSLVPRGYRLLSHVPRMPGVVIDAVVSYFGTLQKVMRATEDDLSEVAGVGEARARAFKRSLSRLVETSILDRYN